MSDSAYSVNMEHDAPPPAYRVRVISPAMIAHCMDHPARTGRGLPPWSTRELAAILGCSPATLSHMRTGSRQTFNAELARRFAEAVGVEEAVLFAPALSTDSDTDLAESA